MPAVRTIARPPLSDSVMVHIPEDYRSYSLEIIVLPMVGSMPDSMEYVSGNDEIYQRNFEESHRRRESAERAFNYLMAQDDGGIAPDWHFDRDEANSRTVDGKPAFMSVRYRLTEDGAAELLAAQHDFEKIDEEMWK